MNNIMTNVEKLFSKPMPSTRSGNLYNTFPYPTKISPEAIAVYIASTTQPGDIILDAFAGSGSTGIATLIAEFPTNEMIEMAKKLNVQPCWGKRNAILYEIGTYATFAIETITNRLKADEYAVAVDDFMDKANKLLGKMYTAKSPDGKDGLIRYAIWTEILVCPKCGAELEYFHHGTSRNPATFRKTIECHVCHATSCVNEMDFVVEDYDDKLLGHTISRKKRKLAWIYGSSEGENWDRPATMEDEKLILNIEDDVKPNGKQKKINWGDLHRTGYHYGITHLHHFYTIRNYVVMSELWNLTSAYPTKESNALKLLLLSYNSAHSTLMTRVVAKHNAKDFVLTGAQSGVLYVSKLPVEKNILFGIRRKAKSFERAYKMLEECNGTVEIRNNSSSRMAEPNEFVDFVFTDPPFGDFIPYAEINQINELWLPKATNYKDEVIISNAQNKNTEKYRDMLADVFSEIKRTAKNNCPIAVVFHAAKAKVWEAFSDAVKLAGLEIKQSNYIDKTQASFKQVVSKSAVQGDLLFLLKKSNERKPKAVTGEEILRKIIEENSHETEKERRHCYSLYVGKCMEYGINVQWDAAQVYDYIQSLMGAKMV